ncbi:MAG: hypothetical protein FWF43_09130 [Propionibacteriaceae bacterium]|nr:hypothetical protein [Propionibacteriaceae bacterium]
MTTEYMAQQVADVFAPVSGLLFQSASNALVLANNRVGDLVSQGDTGLLSRTMRGDFRAQLTGQELHGFRIEGNPARNGELYLRHWETGFLLRFLKESRRTYPGGVPIAGYNSARREWWSQPLQAPIPGLEYPTDREVKLLLLWDLVNAASIEQGIVMRVVHPTAPGRYGSSVPLDLNVELNASGGMWDQLQFVGDDDLADFFPDEEIGDGEQEAI